MLRNLTYLFDPITITCFVTKYKQFLNFSEIKFSLLYDQFMDSQLLFIEELSLEYATLERKNAREKDEDKYRMNMFWYRIQAMKLLVIIPVQASLQNCKHCVDNTSCKHWHRTSVFFSK